ncbi:hypothetical protein [Streptomyces pseudovenezuelae]|uniref:Uncharacterized protein n=1 Tax=Streptomyces pseudovenezuelae TaxID=67350 RepID=A0ABT6M1R7_9ACTN|nr:hypothetical protein [Streptomyces pseudovenezuelae]MDH6222496.1 hypothetical protein [Streptomyces pseudovenezuelae]
MTARTTFADALEEVQFRVPYSSAASYHEYYGTGAPPWRLGRGCGWQTFEVARLVEERCGARPTHLYAGGHSPAMYFGEDDITVLDPYLPHVEPLRLSRADAVSGTVRAGTDAYPIRSRPDGTPAPSRLSGTWWVADGVLLLEYARFSPRRSAMVTHRAFTFHLATELPTFPVPDGFARRLLLEPMQNNLSIRALHRGERRIGELVLPFTGRPREQLVDPAFLIAKDNQGRVSQAGTPDFARVLELIADAVDGTPEEVTAYVMDAAAIYHRVVPLDQKWPDYSAEDE